MAFCSTPTWSLNDVNADLHLASVTLGDIQAGIKRWLDQVSDTFNILNLDGSDTLYEDAMIAAIAKVHHLTVVTRNVAEFNCFAVPLLNPFTGKGLS